MHDVLQDLIKQFMPFAQKQIGFENPPRLFLRNDSENAQNPLGKTAFYDPAAQSVTLYVTDRHPKDILRSLGHELVHHKQNCDGQFDDAGDMGEGYAQKNPHLRRMEEEANQDGSMCLRDFEDMLKKENTIYYEHLQKGDKKMSTKDWKNEELRTILAEAWGFKFNTLKEFDQFSEGADKNTGMSGVAGDDDDDTYMGHFKEGGESKGDESKTHKGEKDYTTKKGDELKHSGKGRGEKKGDKAYVNEDSGWDEKEHDEHNAWNDEDHIDAIEKHLRALRHDRDYEEDHESLHETGAKDTGASKGDKGKDKDDPEAKDYTDGGDRKGDESRTHKGEKDYTTKKGDKLKTSGKGRGEKKGDEAYVNEGSEDALKEAIANLLRKHLRD